MPKKIWLKKLDDEENESIRNLAKDRGYSDKQIDGVLKKIDNYEPEFLDAQRFINWGLRESKIDKVLKLTSDEGLTKLKETNHYIKQGRQLKPKKIKDRTTQFGKAVKDYEKGLKEIEERVWDPETKSIEIKLEGGNTRILTFKNEEQFNAHKEADMENVKRHIEHDKNEVADWNRIKKFKEAIG